MKTVVWKYPLITQGVRTELDLPRDAKVLHFAEQHQRLWIWAAHHPSDEAEVERRAFEILGTGHPTSDDPARYVGTALVENGRFVFHLFEVDP